MWLLHTDPEPVVIHGLGGLEPVSSAHLQQFVDQVNRCGNRDRETSMIPHTHNHKHTPSLEMLAQGSGGYMNAAFCIWSVISSSSLNGNVPLKLRNGNTGIRH